MPFCHYQDGGIKMIEPITAALIPIWNCPFCAHITTTHQLHAKYYLYLKCSLPFQMLYHVKIQYAGVSTWWTIGQVISKSSNKWWIYSPDKEAHMNIHQTAIVSTKLNSKCDPDLWARDTGLEHDTLSPYGKHFSQVISKSPNEWWN